MCTTECVCLAASHLCVEDGCVEDDDIRVSDVHNNEDMKYTDESSKNGEEDAKTYTVEEAVEAIGFGRFQLVVYFVGGTITVSCQLCPPPLAHTAF